jgi:hypothetical protein
MPKMTKVQARRRMTEAIDKIQKVMMQSATTSWGSVVSDRDYDKLVQCSRTLFKIRAKLDRK